MVDDDSRFLIPSFGGKTWTSINLKLVEDRWKVDSTRYVAMFKEAQGQAEEAHKQTEKMRQELRMKVRKEFEK